MSDYRITVVCTGNICRSPMGEWLLRERFEAAGLGHRVVVDSAGTTAWEEGNPADPRFIGLDCAIVGSLPEPPGRADRCRGASRRAPGRAGPAGL